MTQRDKTVARGGYVYQHTDYANMATTITLDI